MVEKARVALNWLASWALFVERLSLFSLGVREALAVVRLVNGATNDFPDFFRWALGLVVEHNSYR